MDDYAIVLNAGSSSLKFSIYRRPEAANRGGGASAPLWTVDLRGQIDGIGTSPRFTAKDGSDARVADDRLAQGLDGRGAFDALASWLRARYGGDARVLGVGHRVVHGGAKYARPTIVTTEVLTDLRALVPLAPLHQPYNLAAIDAVSERLPGVPQVACFDTSFHRGQPAVAEVVPLPRDLCRGGVQRYGFHGLSYEYIASVLPDVAPEIAHGRVIVAHLGSGASLCAMKNLKSIDSTLGFTALDGLCMGTRPGSIDPGVILHLVQTLGLSAKDLETVLYKKSGLLGISGISNDMRDLLDSSEPGARPRGGLLRVSGRKADRRARGGARRCRRARVHGRHRGELGGDSQTNLPGVGVARYRFRRGGEHGTRASDLSRGQSRVGVGRPHERRTHHRPAHRAVARADAAHWRSG